MGSNRRQDVCHARAVHGNCAEDMRIPFPQISQRCFCACVIGLVDHDNVSDFQQAGFHRLNVVSQPRRHDGQDRIGHFEDINITLTDTDRFNENDVEAGGVKHYYGLTRRACQAASLSACRHAANVNSRVQRMCLHSNAIAKERAACAGAADIDRQDTDRLALLAVGSDELIDDGALAGSRIAGHADDSRTVQDRLKCLEDGRTVTRVFEQSDGTRDGADISGLHLGRQDVRVVHVFLHPNTHEGTHC